MVKRISRQRSTTGSLFALAFVGAIPLMLAIGAFAVDTMHFNAVQAEVQRACDAGALAGAIEMWQFSTNPQAPIDAARTVASMNDADGKPVAAVSGATVNPSVEQPPDPNQGGRVRCSIKRPYQNMLSVIFGNYSSSMSCTAVAGPMGQANVASTSALFPLGIALRTPSTHDGQPLNAKNIGDGVYLEFSKNAAWTGFSTHNAHDVDEMIKGYMKPGSGHTGSPPTKVGDNVDVTNGIQAGNVAQIPGFTNDIVYFPVIDESQGNAANTGANLGHGSYTVLGFVAIKVTTVLVNGANSYVYGTVSHGNFRGTFDPASPQVVAGNLPNIQSQPVKLLN